MLFVCSGLAAPAPGSSSSSFNATFGLDYNGVFPFDSRDAMGVRAPRVPCSERTQAVKTTQTAQACCH